MRRKYESINSKKTHETVVSSHVIKPCNEETLRDTIGNITEDMFPFSSPWRTEQARRHILYTLREVSCKGCRHPSSNRITECLLEFFEDAFRKTEEEARKWEMADEYIQVVQAVLGDVW